MSIYSEKGGAGRAGMQVTCFQREATSPRSTALPASDRGWPGSLPAGASLSLEAQKTWILEISPLPGWSFPSGPSSSLPYAFGVLPRAFQMFPKKRPDLFVGLHGRPDTTLLCAA